MSNDQSPRTSIRGLPRQLIELASVRLEILSIEAREAFTNVTEVLIYAVLATFCLCFGLGFLAILLTVLLWDNNRLLVLAVMTTLFFTLGGVAAYRVRSNIRQSAQWFASSKTELKRDAAQFNHSKTDTTNTADAHEPSPSKTTTAA